MLVAMKIVVIIPALNESKTIESVIAGIPPLDGVDCVDTIVVDDGSRDDTAAVARAAGAIVVSHPVNRGVGAAFRTGTEAALAHGADIIVNIDADGQFNPGDIPALIAPILQGEADCVTCTRFRDKQMTSSMPPIKQFGNRLAVWVVNMVTGLRLSDVTCGFRAFTREAALRLTLFGEFTYTQESLIEMAAKRLRIAEVPLAVRGAREHGRSRVVHSISGYVLRSGLIMLRAARDVKPMRFFGTIGLAVLLVGLALGTIVVVHWLFTGKTSPYTQLLVGSAIGLILGFLLLVLALIADMLGRQRRMLEELLYLRRKEAAERASGK